MKPSFADERPAVSPVADEVDDVGSALIDFLKHETPFHPPHRRLVIFKCLGFVGNESVEFDVGGYLTIVIAEIVECVDAVNIHDQLGGFLTVIF